ncbi:TadE/TadG family type IV pilus assembly protein [Roseimaritima ulvae]|uniref:TadE/TadG family type IV pilus assembly protein n=1 Tax=Roseimaritima ulvae TaxID=980254 RepID=UPI0013906BE7|nr:TadE family protein [Roseimaritima ulvae]
MRRGIAAVEFAVILPPMILILLVSLEITHGFTVQHALQEAAMNGCRIYTLGDKTQADAEAMIERSLDEAGISGYTIRYDPPVKADIVADLQPVTVTVTVPYSEVGVGVQWFLAGSDLSAAITLPVDSPPPSDESDDDD